MNRKLFALITRMLVVAAPITLVGCGGATDAPVEPEQAASTGEVQTTVVTDENYGLAESEVIFSENLKIIAVVTP